MIILPLMLTVGCSGGGLQGQIIEDTGTVIDMDGPTITHTAISAPQTYGTSVIFEAVAEDPSGVLSLEVIYKQETAMEWASLRLSEVGAGLFQGIVDGAEIYDASVSYYFLGTDELENSACLPPR